MNKLNNDNYKIRLYTTSLMVMISSADDNIDLSELKVIKDILADYFKIDLEVSEKLIQDSYKVIEDSTDIYEVASFLNDSFTHEEKMKLVISMFKIAYSDKEFHFMERHVINKIGNIFDFNKDKIIKAKKSSVNLL